MTDKDSKSLANAVWKRYIRILISKLTMYSSEEFLDELNGMDYSKKIAFLKKLKDDMDNSYIFRKDSVMKNSELQHLLYTLYSFLYENKNAFSNKSYMNLLRELSESGQGIEFVSRKSELENLEKAFVQKMTYELQKGVSSIKDASIKSKVTRFMRAYKQTFITSAVVLGIIVSLIAFDFVSNAVDDYNFQKHIQKEQTWTNNWLATQNDSSALVNSANFMMLADTCSAWAIIHSLDTLRTYSKVDVAPTASFEEEVNDTTFEQSETRRQRFELLCSQAVNYTISQYSRLFNITNVAYPDIVTIFFTSKETGSLGYYNPTSRTIMINESVLHFGHGANALVLFANISHEMIHLLMDYNLPTMQELIRRVTHLKDMKSRGLMPDSVEVNKFLSMYESYYKYTEVQAWTFEENLFKSFFRGVLSDSLNSYTFKQSYLDKVLLSGSLSQQAYAMINNNLSEIITVTPTLQKELEKIMSMKYNDLDSDIEHYKRLYLKNN